MNRTLLVIPFATPAATITTRAGEDATNERDHDEPCKIARYGQPLFAARYDTITLVDPPQDDPRVTEWIDQEVRCRLDPEATLTIVRTR